MSHSKLKQIYIILTSLLAHTVARNLENPSIIKTQTFDIQNPGNLNPENAPENSETNKTDEFEAYDKLDKEIEEKINALEKEKKELFIELNKAIDSAIDSLKAANNDSAAAEGIEHMTRLKQQVKLMNEADDTGPPRRTNNTRRQANDNFEDEISQDQLLRSLWVLSNDKDKNNEAITQKREKHKIDVQKRLDVWLANRIKMKKEKQERDIMIGNETCPRLGRKGNDRKRSKKKDKNKDKRGKRYPCCRKCCKKSILKCY